MLRVIPISLTIASLFFAALFLTRGESEIETIYGKEKIDHPLIKSLIDAPIMKRMKNVDQSGVSYYYGYIPKFSRYSHSVGVYALLKRFDAPFDEQLSGLLHDTSHTVFSHLGDLLFNMKSPDDAYQDTIHDWYLEKMQIGSLLQPHDLSIEEINPKNTRFLALEQDLPDMCADRIEYNLHTAYVLDIMDKEEIEKILSDLRFDGKKWFFVNADSAKDFARLPLRFTEHLWGAPWNYALNYWFGRAVTRAVGLGMIKIDEIHFETDEYILSKLLDSEDDEIQMFLKRCENVRETYKEVVDEPFDIDLKPKFRGVDPLLKIDGKLLTLTEFDSSFKEEFERVRNKMQEGIKISFLVGEKDFEKEFLPE